MKCLTVIVCISQMRKLRPKTVSNFPKSHTSSLGIKLRYDELRALLSLSVMCVYGGGGGGRGV